MYVPIICLCLWNVRFDKLLIDSSTINLTSLQWSISNQKQFGNLNYRNLSHLYRINCPLIILLYFQKLSALFWQTVIYIYISYSITLHYAHIYWAVFLIIPMNRISFVISALAVAYFASNPHHLDLLLSLFPELEPLGRSESRLAKRQHLQEPQHSGQLPSGWLQKKICAQGFFERQQAHHKARS